MKFFKKSTAAEDGELADKTIAMPGKDELKKLSADCQAAVKDQWAYVADLKALCKRSDQ